MHGGGLLGYLNLAAAGSRLDYRVLLGLAILQIGYLSRRLAAALPDSLNGRYYLLVFIGRSVLLAALVDFQF